MSGLCVIPPQHRWVGWIYLTLVVALLVVGVVR